MTGRAMIGVGLLLFAACHPEPHLHVADAGPLVAVDAGLQPYTGPFNATVIPHPENVVCALVQVESAGADSVVVVSGPNTSYGATTPSLPMTGGRATVPVCSLSPQATSHFQVSTFADGSPSAHSGDLTFAMGTLPPGFPSLTVKMGSTTSPYVGMGLIWNTASGALGSASTIVDSTGRLVWYKLPQSGNGGYYLEAPGPGRFLVWDGTYADTPQIFAGGTAQYLEEDLGGNVLHIWSDTWPSYYASGLDMTFLPSGNVALLGYSMLTDVTVPWGAGMVTGQTVLSESIDEVTPDGGAVFHWQSWPSIVPAEVTDGWAPGDIFEPHGNSLDSFPDGGFLDSMHAISAILKIDTNGNIEWQLGGDDNQFQYVNDPRGGFGGQHDTHLLPNGDILMMDNLSWGGLNGNQLSSRAVEYRLDENAKTATLVWAYYLAAGMVSGIMGSARRMANGNTLIAFGELGLVREVDPGATVVLFEMQTAEPGAAPPYIYRAVPISSLY